MVHLSEDNQVEGRTKLGVQQFRR